MLPCGGISLHMAVMMGGWSGGAVQQSCVPAGTCITRYTYKKATSAVSIFTASKALLEEATKQARPCVEIYPLP